jgi:pentatricopeptide repeat protein
MWCRIIEHDIFNYNTFIDVVCKGGWMELATTIMMLMHQKSITPNVVIYNTMINGYANLALF